MKTDTTRWPEERVEALKSLRKAGLTGSQIARALNARFPGATYTRNAIIAKLDRLNIDMRPGAREATIQLSNKLRAASKPAIGVANNCQVFERAPDARPYRSAFIDPPGLATSDTLGKHMCKWPIGDPRRRDFTFCGKVASKGPYCHDHHQRAYEPATPQQKKSAMRLASMLRRYA